MKYRIFGKTGWRVSEIGFGGWQLGGNFGSVDDDESVKTLLKAWELGINFVDTAQMYGRGRSEEVIGRALRQWSGDHIYVATKVQPVQWPPASESDPDMAGKYPAAYLREQCEASLQRLGVEAIDLYQLHGWFPRGVQHTEWYETLHELKREGKIRAIGISIRDYRPEDGVVVAGTGMVDAEQVIYNIFEQRPASSLFPACQASDVAVIARVPFDESALIGNWTPDTYHTWEQGDVRRTYFKNDRFAVTLARVEQLKRAIAEKTGDRFASLADVALRYCLSHPAVSCVIPGMKNEAELLMNVRAADGELLPDELLATLRTFNWPRNYHNPNEEADPSR